MLIAAAALDLTRCSLVLMTFRHLTSASVLVAAGIGATALSVAAARGCLAGNRWAAPAALLIGVASAPQASASGFSAPYLVPDVATAVLGVLLAVAVLATLGGTWTPANPGLTPCKGRPGAGLAGPVPGRMMTVSGRRLPDGGCGSGACLLRLHNSPSSAAG
jgi:hypothetical protein